MEQEMYDPVDEWKAARDDPGNCELCGTRLTDEEEHGPIGRCHMGCYLDEMRAKYAE